MNRSKLLVTLATIAILVIVAGMFFGFDTKPYEASNPMDSPFNRVFVFLMWFGVAMWIACHFHILSPHASSAAGWLLTLGAIAIAPFSPSMPVAILLMIAGHVIGAAGPRFLDIVLGEDKAVAVIG